MGVFEGKTSYEAMWLKKNEPETYRKTYKFLLVQDCIIYKLTGREENGSGRPNFFAGFWEKRDLR